MLFWLKAVTRYLLVALGSLLLSIAISLLAMLPFARQGDDLGIAFLWILVFLPIASLAISLSLGITAELIERKVTMRHFKWSNALVRSVIALPIAVGPVYAAISVAPYREDRRPAHWVEKEILLYAVSAVFAFLALRIKRPLSPTP